MIFSAINNLSLNTLSSRVRRLGNQAVHPSLVGFSNGTKHAPIDPTVCEVSTWQNKETNKLIDLIYRHEMFICGIYTNYIYDAHHQQIGNLQVIPLIVHSHCHRPPFEMAPSTPFQQLCDPRVTRWQKSFVVYIKWKSRYFEHQGY